MRGILLLICVLFLVITPAFGNTIYVSGAGDNSDGTSWSKAYTSLQTALAASVSGDQIWLAAGIYKPTLKAGGTSERNKAFQMKNGVGIYGGFDGIDDDELSDRDISANVTILSGDIGNINDNSDNCYHVIYNDESLALTGSAILDGVTVTGANGNGSSPNDWGGGVHNYGSSATFQNCIFRNNYSNCGGGIFNRNSASVISNCVFTGNSAMYGGAILTEGASVIPIIANCTISGNSASYMAGGLFISASHNPSIKNSIFWGNFRTGSPASASEIELNGIASPVFTYCCIRGGYTGVGNISGNPKFVDADGTDNIYGTGDDNFKLQDNSPCIGAGTSSGTPGTDIFNAPRGTPPDIGAYENILNSPVYAICVNVNASGINNGVGWSNAYTSLQSAISSAVNGDQIWVAKGTYKPTSGTNRLNYFNMKDGVAIYGGFAGTETSVSQRVNYGWGQVNETILSGDIGVFGDSTDNCYNVLYARSAGSTTRLDGFSITGGNANGGPSLNYGGGIYLWGCSAIINSCTFYRNSAAGGGGAIYNLTGSSSIINCIFFNNWAELAGAGMDSEFASPLVINCTFSGNGVVYSGAAMGNKDSSPIITNTIFWGDYKTSPPGVSELFNGTPVVTHSCIQNGYSGDGNISLDPLFVDAANKNFKLQNYSPCIGSATATGAPATDFFCSSRGTPPDMGALENILDIPLPVELTLFTAAIYNGKTVLKWQTATEINSYGFEVERLQNYRIKKLQDWVKIGFVSGSGNSNAVKEYLYSDDKISENGSYLYRLKQIDIDGSFKYSDVVEVRVNTVPKEFVLEQNYPNPFNPSTVIRCALPEASRVQIEIYNALGERAAQLVNDIKEEGYYQVEWNAAGLASGIYFYTIYAKSVNGNKDFRTVKKMILIK